MVFGDDEFGLWEFNFTTPDAFKAQIDASAAEFDSLDSDVSLSSVAPAFKNDWTLFYNSFKKFQADMESGWLGGWTSRIWTTNMDTLKNFQAQLVDWASKFTSLGGVINGRTPTTPPKQPGLFDDVKTLIYGGIALAAIVYVAPMLGVLKPKK